MKAERGAICDLLAEYGALIDMAKFDEWLGLFAEECRYQIVPRENFDRGLPAALVFCDSRAMLEDRIRALREANKYNIHTDRHVIGLPRILEDGHTVEVSFAVYQTTLKERPGYSRPASTATGSRSWDCASRSATSWSCSTPSPSPPCSQRRCDPKPGLPICNYQLSKK